LRAIVCKRYRTEAYMSKTFKERYLSHEIELEAIDDYIIEWNNSDTEETLAKFLGLNKEEETAWVEDSDDALFDLLEAQRK
jgi:hypothetical protein